MIAPGFAKAPRRARFVLPVAAAVALVLAVGCAEHNKKKYLPTAQQNAGVLHYRLGQQQLKDGRPDLAVPEFQAAIADDPKNSLNYNMLGLAYLGLERYAEAKDAFEKTLAINPYYTDAHNNLGIVYSETQEFDEAVREFEKVLADKSYGTPEVARYNMGRIFLAKGDAQTAQVYLSQALSGHQENGEWHVQLGLALEKLERYAEASLEFVKAVDQDPRAVEAVYHLGYSQYMLKNYRRARENFNRVLVLAPKGELAEKAEQYLKTLG